MGKRILTLDDLYSFYANRGRSTTFNAKNDGDRIMVSVPAELRFEEEDKDKEGLLPVSLQACHTKKNVNGSFISEESMTNALPSFSNRPILGFIYKDENGEYQFKDHTMHMEDDELIYDEKCIGIIPESCNAHLEYDKDKDKTYVRVDGYIFEGYSQAKEILDREGECSVSVELSIRELSYDAKNKVLNIDDFYFSGVTILGKWEDGSDVLPGMAGSNIKISDFKQKNFDLSAFTDAIEQLKALCDQFSINNQGKEESQMGFEDNVEATESPAAEEAETMENAAETTENADETTENAEETVENDGETTENMEEASEGEADNTEAETAESTEGESDSDTSSDEDDNETPSEEENFRKVFEISHEDIRCALYTLLYPYEEEDNDWYWITSVYEDHFIYEGYDPDHKYSQGYKVEGDNVSFEGDRVHMNVEYLTDSELVALNEIRSNYDAINEKLQKYEAEPQKMEILNSEEYAGLSESEEFNALKEMDAHFDLSVDEVRAKADEMLLAYAKSGSFTAPADADKKSIGMKKLPMNTPKRSGRYGSLFSKN